MHQSASQLGSDTLTSERTGQGSSVRLLHSISLPASSDPTFTDWNLPPSALVLTPLLPSKSQPASFSLTNTDPDLQNKLVPTPLPPGISPPASFHLTDLKPTDLNLQLTPTLALLCYTDKGRTVLLVSVLRPVVTSLTCRFIR